jgi:phage baseplate assembly protein W
MDSATGRALGEMDHIRQSVRDILATRIGSRVMRRDYGSLIPDLIDQPGNAANLLRLRAATVMALIAWEPRLHVTRVGFALDAAGNASVDLDAVRRGGPRGNAAVSLSVQV